MDVVRHHDPSEELVELPLLPRPHQCVDHTSGDSGILQPRRTRTGAVHLPIEGEESMAFRESRGSWGEFFLGQRSEESPGQEYRHSFRVPVGQSAAIETHTNTVEANKEISQPEW